MYVYLNVRSKDCHGKLRYARNASCSGLLPPRLGNMAGKSGPPPSSRYTPANILLLLGCYLRAETKPGRYCAGVVNMLLLPRCYMSLYWNCKITFEMAHESC